MTTKPPIQVEIAEPFVKKLKRLLKKYSHAYEDVQGLISQLERGETPGDQVQQTGYTVYKVRVRNSDVPKGKSGGYRVIYYVRTPVRVTLIMIYSKTEQTDISAEIVKRLIEDLE